MKSIQTGMFCDIKKSAKSYDSKKLNNDDLNGTSSMIKFYCKQFNSKILTV